MYAVIFLKAVLVPVTHLTGPPSIFPDSLSYGRIFQLPMLLARTEGSDRHAAKSDRPPLSDVKLQVQWQFPENFLRVVRVFNVAE